MKNITLSLLIVSAFTLSCREEDPAWWDEPLGFAGDDALSGVELPITLCTIANPAQVVAITKVVRWEPVRHTDCAETKYYKKTYGLVTLEVQASSDLNRLPLGTTQVVDVIGDYDDRMLVTLSEFDGEWILVSRFRLVESEDGNMSAVDDAIFDFPTTWNGFREEIALNNADYSNRCKDWTREDEDAFLDLYLGPGTACALEAEGIRN